MLKKFLSLALLISLNVPMNIRAAVADAAQDNQEQDNQESDSIVYTIAYQHVTINLPPLSTPLSDNAIAELFQALVEHVQSGQTNGQSPVDANEGAFCELTLEHMGFPESAAKKVFAYGKAVKEAVLKAIADYVAQNDNIDIEALRLLVNATIAAQYNAMYPVDGEKLFLDDKVQEVMHSLVKSYNEQNFSAAQAIKTADDQKEYFNKGYDFVHTGLVEFLRNRYPFENGFEEVLAGLTA